MHETIDTSAAVDLLYPLNEFYELAGLALPDAVRLKGRAMPAPFRHLLVHDRDMTPTLEAAYDRKMNLHVLKYSFRDEIFSREIVLVPEGSDVPVVFGAIKIYLDEFPTEAREMVLERKLPLGTILELQGIKHFSRPDGFFEVASDAFIEKALGIEGPARLYGRRNMLGNGVGRKLAQVVEIVPPTHPIPLSENYR
jgi:chorismate-pyruvate lyase